MRVILMRDPVLKRHRDEEEEKKLSASASFRRVNNEGSMNVDSMSSFSQCKKNPLSRTPKGSKEKFQTDNDEYIKF